MTKQEAIRLINIELKNAIAKYPEWPTDIIHAAAVVNEEAGELIRACLNHSYHGADEADVQREAIQTAAMAIRFIMNSDWIE